MIKMQQLLVDIFHLSRPSPEGDKSITNSSIDIYCWCIKYYRASLKETTKEDSFIESVVLTEHIAKAA